MTIQRPANWIAIVGLALTLMGTTAGVVVWGMNTAKAEAQAATDQMQAVLNEKLDRIQNEVSDVKSAVESLQGQTRSLELTMVQHIAQKGD